MNWNLPKNLGSEVMSRFGTGFSLSASIPFAASDGEKVAGGRMRCPNFGSNGSIMVEGVKVGATAEEITANARANREFLEKVQASA